MNHLLDYGISVRRPENERLTCHKIALTAFISSYIKTVAQIKTGELTLNETEHKTRYTYRKDFVMVVLRLMQGPDLSHTEFLKVLVAGEYMILPAHLKTYHDCLANICANGINEFLELQRFLCTAIGDEQSVKKNSLLGCYVRRFALSVERHSFAELVAVYENFKGYYEKGAGEVIVGKRDSPVSMELTDMSMSHRLDATESFTKKVQYQHEQSIRDFAEIEENQYSRRQAEYFIATQARLLSYSTTSALPAPVLAEKIDSLLTSNANLSEAYFLGFLNCLRTREYCGAIANVFQCFERKHQLCEVDLNQTDPDAPDKKGEGYRYGLLYLAILYDHFNKRDKAKTALKEAIRFAQADNDVECLQTALTHYYRLSARTNKRQLIEKAVRKNHEHFFYYMTCLAMEAFVHYMAVHGAKPEFLFKALEATDLFIARKSETELMLNNYQQKAAMWRMYGKHVLATVWSQAGLHVKTDTMVNGFLVYDTEAICRAICDVAVAYVAEGEYKRANVVLNHARERFPDEPFAAVWKVWENVGDFHQAFHMRMWSKARDFAKQVATHNQPLSQLLLAEMYLHKQDYDACFATLTAFQTLLAQSDDIDARWTLKVRGLIVLAEYHKRTKLPELECVAEAMTALNDALAIARKYYLHYYEGLIHMHIAHLHLTMKLANQATASLSRGMHAIMTHGGAYDRARAMLLFVKCHVEQVQGKEKFTRVLVEDAGLLDQVSAGFEAVQNFSRARDARVLQAILFNAAGCVTGRNASAARVKALAERYNLVESNDLLVVV